MARRATLFHSLRDTSPTAGKTVFLAGAFEFLPDGPEQKPEGKVVPALAKAFGLLGYDAGALTPEEESLVRSAGEKTPAHFTVLGQAPKTEVVKAGGHSIGIVFFPLPRDPKAPVPAGLMAETAKAAGSLRGKAELVVGVSDWGLIDEETFANTQAGAVDVLLGSGGGAGTAGRAAGSGKTLWARAYIKGKTVNRLDLYALPGAGGFAWQPGVNYKAEVVSLDDSIAAAPEIQKLF